MTKKPIAGRDTRAWAGSAKSEARNLDGRIVETLPRDVYKLHELRHKIDDVGYVDGAVSRIANFLTSTLDRKGKDEQ